MRIRPEKPSEYRFIYNLVKVAFQTAKVSDGDEQDYVDRLRCGDGYIPELALVAEESKKIFGHIIFTKTCVLTGTQRVEALLLAELSVELAHRNCGVGASLVREGLRRAKSMGYESVFVVGDPAYYSRFSFRSSTRFGIKHIPEIPDPYVMAIELTPNALAGVSGTVTFI